MIDRGEIVGSQSEAGQAHGTPAERALAEAEARRHRRDEIVAVQPKEIDGRSGPEPVRYGDWENKGIASDF